MTIEERLNEELKRALKSGDVNVRDAIRMVKTKLAEKRTSPGFKGPVTDEVVTEVIRSYIRSLEKAIEEIERGGGKESPLLAKYRFEIEYLSGYLPRLLTEEETRQLARQTIAELGVSGPQGVGRVVGAMMKAHKERLDGALVRRVVEEELGVRPKE